MAEISLLMKKHFFKKHNLLVSECPSLLVHEHTERMHMQSPREKCQRNNQLCLFKALLKGSSAVLQRRISPDLNPKPSHSYRQHVSGTGGMFVTLSIQSKTVYQ